MPYRQQQDGKAGLIAGRSWCKGFLAKMRWVQLFVCLVLGGSAYSLQCPDGHSCKGSSVCCKLSGEDGYSCCDQPQFTAASLRMFPPQDNSLHQVAEPSGVTCLDGRVCPAEYSCLRTPDDDLACCPWKEGISCAGGHYCCPLGSRCSRDGKSCSKSEVPTFPARVSAVQCPDGESECPNESTCCMMPDGVWGCCPMPEALCCEDKIHCCPHNTTCDLPHARCFAASGEHPLQKKFPASRRAVLLDSPRNSLCPGNQSSCPDTDTCCILPTGQYGCCHLPNAVCCRDHLHCCPQGTTCDLEHSRCTMTPQRSWPILHLAADLRQTVGVVQCDDEHTCPDGNTCCLRSPGEWGCCPLEEAVCCSDHIHCCPKGYTCNVATGICDKGGRSIPWLAKAEPRSLPVSSAGTAVPCDAHTECPDGHTCCRLSSGAWGCCPLPEAICCNDSAHCCPANYQCNLSEGTCMKNGSSIPWLEKKPAVVGFASLSRNVKCNDEFSCSDGQTCCTAGAVGWACCPFPQAVCCSDQKHCCPGGYTCDVEHGSCVQSGQPSRQVSMALIQPREVNDIRCDDEASCPDGHTCCRMPSGEWGCCPFPEAVCCPDRVHCCPKDYTCDPGAKTCQSPQHSLPWVPKHPAGVTQNRGIRCNDTTSCEEGQTCCRDVSGGWSCCQLPNAVCCEDHKHCCPSGYTCNVAARTCEKQFWPSLLPAGGLLSSSRTPTSGRDVSCGDQHYCHDHQTCCKSSSGGWACCPYDKGSCCSDKRHCCPSGFRCSWRGTECIKQKPLRWDTGAFTHRSTQAHTLL
ncbi:Uncharacterized protein PODLI_1B030954 [Podarcis lilfordi]|uniref:Granulins domain-containing protein n=2 Tax=Podarcis lilfordi TaxID=74358 RepID=A0AA35L4X1_9SAUR|nr:Uncharacterized protein PODLI_1B030954 [Podarcis lilfordi]